MSWYGEYIIWRHVNTAKFLDILASYGLTQHVQGATHDAGGTLDIVCTRSDLPSPNVDVLDFSLSDHRLLRWSTQTCRPAPVFTTSTRRCWRSFDQDTFRTYLLASALCDPQVFTDLDCDEIFWLPLKLSLLRGSHPKCARANPQQCTQSAPDFIQIGSLLMELLPNAWTPPNWPVE